MIFSANLQKSKRKAFHTLNHHFEFGKNWWKLQWLYLQEFHTVRLLESIPQRHWSTLNLILYGEIEKHLSNIEHLSYEKYEKLQVSQTDFDTQLSVPLP